jgi:Kelch motif protein
VDSVWVFDPSSARIRLIGHLPAPIGHARAITLGDRVYVVGGRDAAGRPVRSVTEVDPRGRTIIRLRRLARPVADEAAAMLQGKGWLIGGWRGATVADVLRASLERSPA